MLLLLLLLLRIIIIIISGCRRRIRIRNRVRVRVGGDLLGSGIRVQRAVVKNRVLLLGAEMGVDVGGES